MAMILAQLGELLLMLFSDVQDGLFTQTPDWLSRVITILITLFAPFVLLLLILLDLLGWIPNPWPWLL